MLTVSLEHLMTAIKEAPQFSFPEPNAGVGYIYKEIYPRLLTEEGVLFSLIDFNAFEEDDINIFRDLISDHHEDEYKACKVERILCDLKPVAMSANFV